MTTYSYSQLETLWLNTAKGTKYGTTAWAQLMAAIAMAESSGNSDAQNPSGASGLWQILGAPGGWTGSTNWLDPTVNAQAALAKLQSQGLGAWTTYTSGAYKQFLKSGVDPSTLPTTTGASGNGQDASLTSIIGDAGNIASEFSSIANVASDLMKPTFWLRVGAFFAGVTLLGIALWSLIKTLDPDLSIPTPVPVPVP